MSNSKRHQKSGGKKRKSKASKRVQPVLEDLPELQQARALWMRHRFPQAIKLFEEAVRKHPNNPIALTDAARALGDRYEFSRAERMLQRLQDIAGRRANLLQMAGQSYRMIQRPARAIECLELALTASPDLVESRLELALLYERRHQLENALQHVSECVERNPESLEAQFLQGRVLRRLGKESEAENLLRSVATSTEAHAIVRSQAWHELAQLFDSNGQYDEAFRAVVQGKEVQMTEAGDLEKRSKKEGDGVENVLREIKSSHFQRWREEAEDWQQERVAFLTGPPRSGTTLLEKVLDSHPDVVSSDEQIAFPKYILPSLLLSDKEQNELGVEDLDNLSSSELLEQRERYLRYLADVLGEPFGERLHIDKNPSLVMLIPGMLRLFPECKLLIAIRDPRDVLVSCFMRYLPLNTVSVHFSTPERAAKRNIRDMEGWLKLRDLIGSPWLEVKYEDTVEDLEREARRALEFLGVEWDSQVLSYRDQLHRRQVNSPTYEDVAKPVYRSSVGRWKNYQSHLGPVLDLMEPLLQKLGYAT